MSDVLVAVEVFAQYFSELIRLLSASAFWCAVAQIAHSYFTVAQISFMVPSAFMSPGVRYVGIAGEEMVVVSHVTQPVRENPFDREIARLRPDGSDTRLRLRMPTAVVASSIPLWRGSDGFVVTGNDWWYATLDLRDGLRGGGTSMQVQTSDAALTFVKSDGSRTTHVRPSVANRMKWYLIAVPGEQPRALEVTFPVTLLDDTIITELDWSGARRSWRLRPTGSTWPPSITAELLPDGRIALFSNEAGLSMYLLSDEGNIETIVLRNVRIRQFDTAIDDAGRIAIAAARKDEATIDAAVIDVADPEKAEWHTLRRDAVVRGYLRELQVVTKRNGFVAAWINDLDGRRIEATELSARGRRGPIVDVGQASPRGERVFLDVQPMLDELLFWWDDGERLVQRRLPLSLSGYAVMRDLTQCFCSAGEADHN